MQTYTVACGTTTTSTSPSAYLASKPGEPIGNAACKTEVTDQFCSGEGLKFFLCKYNYNNNVRLTKRSS